MTRDEIIGHLINNGFRNVRVRAHGQKPWATFDKLTIRVVLKERVMRVESRLPYAAQYAARCERAGLRFPVYEYRRIGGAYFKHIDSVTALFDFARISYAGTYEDNSHFDNLPGGLL